MADVSAPYRIEGATGTWEVVIGLEVHAQITSQAKLFSGASTRFGSEPNANVSLIDAAMPGMLPVPNRECIRQAVRTGMAIGAQINAWSRFDRKNYFYADLPQGYQISQLYHPLVGEGAIDVEPERGETKTIGVERIHVEQDAGKLMHDQHPTRSYVDLNRSGVALMEIVSRPDMRSPAEAGAYLRKLRAILRYVGSCDGNMEEGSMRADVNVSVRKVGDETLGTRTETKNVNSVRFVMATIEHEARRQIAVIEDGGKIVQETRLFDPDKNVTRLDALQGRRARLSLFPRSRPAAAGAGRGVPGGVPGEPARTAGCQAGALCRRARVVGLCRRRADRRCRDGALVRGTAGRRRSGTGKSEGEVAKAAANWLTSDLFGALNRLGREIGDSPVSPAQGAALLALVADGTLSGSLAKQVFEIMLETGDDPAAIVEARGLKQTSDTGAIEAEIAKIIAANPDKVADYRGGKDKLFGFFVGQTMRAMAGKANPAVVNDLLKKALG